MLNAKPEHAAREAETVAEAGQPGAVTIATNMAGRGVDIKLGGNPEHLARPGAREGGRSAPRTPRSTSGACGSCCRSSSGAWRRPRARDGGRRAVHLRHRAPRVAADRQPAARPRRAPGRSRRVAVLPVGRGRSREAVRGRSHLPDPRQTRRRRRGGQRGTDRGGDAVEADRESPEEGRGAEFPAAQTRARVRRRRQRAAPRDLRLSRRGARGQADRRGGAPRGREHARAHDRAVHARRLHGGLGPRRPVHGARAVLPARPRRRGPRPREGRPDLADRARDRAGDRALQRARGRSSARS